MFHWYEPKIIQDNQGGPFPLVQQFQIGAIGFGHGEFFNKTSHPRICNLVAPATSLAPGGASQVAFTTTGGTSDQDIDGTLDETAIGQ